MNSITILRSGISVYEVEVDLDGWSRARTDKLDGFNRHILRAFPGLRRHECFEGECGGFVKELRAGTDLAHVIEHLTLELLREAYPGGRRISGWTRRRDTTHIIHFQAPESGSAQRAAECAVEIVERILAGKRVYKKKALESIRSSGEAGQQK
jgi:cyanophycin synthetase